MPSIRSHIIKGILKSISAYRNKHNLDIFERRAGMEKISKLARLSTDIEVNKTSIDGMYAEWICSPGAAKDKVILYLHGGAYSVGSANTHRVLAGAVSKAAGARVFLPEYRLCPEHVFPAALEDALKAYRWLLEEGIKDDSIIIAGDSAGGGLSVAVTMALRDIGEYTPCGVICLSPWVDLASTDKSYNTKDGEDPLLITDNIKKAALIYAGLENLKNPLVSPVYGDFKGFPPLFIQVGTEELLYDDAVTLEEYARSAGVDVTLKIWPGMWHVWHVMGKVLPESGKAIEEIGIYARNYFSRSKTL